MCPAFQQEYINSVVSDREAVEPTLTSNQLKVLDQEELDALWRVVRKLSDTQAMLVVQVLSDYKALAFGELMKETSLSVNDLNHTLTDLKRLKVIIQDKSDKKYHITNYGELILRMLWSLARILAKENGITHP